MAARKLFRVGKLVDGSGTRPVAHAAVLVDGDTIVAAGPASAIGLPDGVEVIDAPDAVLIPGLIDAHVHLAYSGRTERAAFRNEHVELNYAEVALRAARYARQTLQHGFTSLRDLHAPGGTIIDLGRAQDRGDVLAPRIIACGSGLSITGGHMDQPGWADQVALTNMTTPCDGPEGFRHGVREQIKRGAQFIKLNTGTSTTKVPGIYGRLEMSPEEIRAACDEAHRNEMLVASHCVAGDPIAVSIENGVDCIEHGHFADQAIIDLMAAKGTYFVPTLALGVTPGQVAHPRNGQGCRCSHLLW
jgi:imidazolonepropionase-like amidohydrolase